MTLHKERLNARRTRAFFTKKNFNLTRKTYHVQNKILNFQKNFRIGLHQLPSLVVPFIYPVNSLGKKQSLSGDRCIAFLRCV